MEKSGFFNAMKVGDAWDRVYKAEDFADYFATFIGNGIFPNPASQLQVVQIDKMQVILKPGKAWINGYKYENTDDLILNIDVADGVLNRIDKIVLRYDVTKREIRSYVKKGEFSSKPTSPAVTRNTDIYELALADISISAGAINISQSDITDLRFNKSLCGIVKGTVDEIDATNLFAQYNCEFNKWFEGIKNTLGADIAGNLLKLITQNTNKIGDTSNLKTTDKTSTVQAINEVKQNLESIKFPVTKVNEQTGNVVLSASDIKMGNTKTIEDNINAITNGIGCRNLVDSLNLEKYFTAENIEGTIQKLDDKYPVSKKYFKIDCTKDGKGTFFFPIFQKIEEKVGRIYTFSFYLLSNREKKLNLGHQCGGGKNVTTRKGWQKVTHTWKFTDGAQTNFYFTFIDGWKVGDTICIADLKIEEGSVPSTWTPAPEDVDAHFSKIETNQGDLKTLKTIDKTSTVHAINELFISANNGKTAVANAIAAKNVPASPTDTFAILAKKIGQIDTKFKKIWYGKEHMEFKLVDTNSISTGTKFTVQEDLAIMNLSGDNKYMKVKSTDKIDVTGAKFLITKVVLSGYKRENANFTISLLNANGYVQFSKTFIDSQIYSNTNIIDLPNLVGEYYIEISCTTPNSSYVNDYNQANIWHIILA